MQGFIQSIRVERKLVGFSLFLLLASALLGYANARPIQELLQQAGVWEQLKQAANSIKQNPTFANTFAVIFLNNLRASAVMIGLGIFLGIFPALALISNGLMLGVVLGQASRETGLHPLVVFATSILPHGILELPAVIFAAAYGIRLGITFARWSLSWISPERLLQSKEDWQSLFARIPYAVGGIVVMLVLAALIESGLIVYLSSIM
ncbi:hypothetical protein GCM10011571_23320 [Marinithermofilum abyssi]|uniref:Stage II sporulation protein M n=1 Tax=Marinithermofilum abyssi TaxID=1571185 RepID=A0A8J2VGG2_9BACL|nr:stage II sporulation protein M [Marinithermofilum abyssi]GGE20681.1 hypothetical protein GCM10011571_23320 [Marinithermofilum abyssi]